MRQAIREIQVCDLAELVEVVTPKQFDPESGRLRARTVFRGVSDPEYSLLTSLGRIGVPELPPHSKAHLEEYLLRNFLRYSRPHLAVMPSNPWEVLVVAQHHGLPTRLLDWSHSPLTAAHFATVGGRANTDRVVWMLDWGRVHDRFGLPPVALMVEELDLVLAEKGVESIWRLFGGSAEIGEHFLCLLEPPALDARIVAQSAAFTLCSDRSRGVDEVLSDAGIADCLTRCVIPTQYVQRVRDQLDLCGVDERRLFPDLDGVAAEMRRYYSANPWGQPSDPAGQRRAA